jgi:hypothetical protein
VNGLTVRDFIIDVSCIHAIAVEPSILCGVGSPSGGNELYDGCVFGCFPWKGKVVVVKCGIMGAVMFQRKDVVNGKVERRVEGGCDYPVVEGFVGGGKKQFAGFFVVQGV